MPGVVFYQSASEFVTSIGRETNLPPIREWLQITDCIHRGSLFSVAAHNAAVRASLRFDPTNPTKGDYEMTFSAHRHPENGTIRMVKEMDEDDCLLRSLGSLLRFPHRYHVSTLANDRQRTKLVWFVAIDQFKEFPAEAENEVA